MPEALAISPDARFLRRIERAGGASPLKCMQCATCSAVCNLTPEDRPFPRKEMVYAHLGLKERLAGDPDLWLCHQCSDCSVRCPRGVNPGEVIAGLRNWVIERFAFPTFMGRALSSPSALPLLLMLPVLAVTVMLMVHTGGDLSSLLTEPVEYGRFVPHGYVELLFISGNVLIFAFAAVGLWRFYRAMTEFGGKPSGGVWGVVANSVAEILVHRRFTSCQAARYRRLAHLLIFFGFFGAMTTAGLALIAMVAFDYGPPIPLSHPIKWLGNASGLAMLFGLGIALFQRAAHPKESGQGGYNYWLFVGCLALVALTGMLLQVWRLADLRVWAYVTYFVHLVAVFFLLWYAPYSQLGHMFYRTLAMAYAAAIGRRALPKAA